jgi:hypothetical protein
MKVMPCALALLLGLSLAGCATDWSRNVYEGIRQRQDAVPDPVATPPKTQQPDYEQYRRERDALSDGTSR